MTNQLTIYEQLDVEAIAQVEANADAAWIALAHKTVHKIAKTYKLFTTDHVWSELDKSDIRTHDNRAMGPVIRQAIADGIISQTGSYQKTSRRVGHNRPVPIYVSWIR